VDGLFTDEDLRQAEEEKEEDKPSRPVPKKLKKTSRRFSGDGYYATLVKNLREGGYWLQFLFLTSLVFTAVAVGIALWQKPRDASVGDALVPMVPVVLLCTVGLAIWFIVEAVILGVPFLAIDKDWTGLDILEVFARTYFYGCLAVLFAGFIYVGNPEAGTFLQLSVPFFQAGVFAYLACTLWDMKLWAACCFSVGRFLVHGAMIFVLSVLRAT
jgi:hypothetical protein